MKYDAVLVLDFGGQYCHLIGRRIREHKVYSEIVPHNIKAEEIKLLNEKFNVKGLILSGGPASVFSHVHTLLLSKPLQCLVILEFFLASLVKN
jgi:GMP synthase-like glutamine amidotransferase